MKIEESSDMIEQRLFGDIIQNESPKQPVQLFQFQSDGGDQKKLAEAAG